MERFLLGVATSDITCLRQAAGFQFDGVILTITIKERDEWISEHVLKRAELLSSLVKKALGDEVAWKLVVEKEHPPLGTGYP